MKTTPKAEIYKDSAGEWRWRVTVRREVIGCSSEGYQRKVDCKRGALRVLTALYNLNAEGGL